MLFGPCANHPETTTTPKLAGQGVVGNQKDPELVACCPQVYLLKSVGLRLQKNLTPLERVRKGRHAFYSMEIVMGSKHGSPCVTDETAAYIKLLVGRRGYMQHDAAALFGINQGRVSEIMTGKRFGHVPPASELPPHLST